MACKLISMGHHCIWSYIALRRLCRCRNAHGNGPDLLPQVRKLFETAKVTTRYPLGTCIVEVPRLVLIRLYYRQFGGLPTGLGLDLDVFS